MAARRQRFVQRRKAVGFSQEGLAEQLGVDRSTVARWEAGETEPQPWMRPELARVLQVSMEQLDELLAEAGGPAALGDERLSDALKHPPSADLVTVARLRERVSVGGAVETRGDGLERDMVVNAAHDSGKHAAASESGIVGTNALEQIVEEIARIARVYVSTAPLSLLSELVGVRDRVYWLLDRTCYPHQQRDLYVIAGQSCGLLASASFDLGYPQAAAEQARAARAYAEIAGHRELCAWADGSLASIQLWAGRPEHAVFLAERGLAVAPEGTAQVRLWCIAARAVALLGDEHRALELIGASKRARDTRTGPTELHDGVGGEFGFGPARQAFCNGSAYLRVGRLDEAVAECRQAVALYAQVEAGERWYAAEAGSQADLATALVLRGDLADAREVLNDVLALHPDKRVEGVVRRVGALHELLTRPEFRNHEGRALAEEIEQFTAVSATPAHLSGPWS